MIADNDKKLAFIFPGMGTQSVGMGRALYEAYPAARETFQEVNDALSQDLTRIMFENPDDQLTFLENAQPAIVAVSIATVRVLENESNSLLPDMASFVAGHSLGEYAALCAAGAPLGPMMRVLKKRGQAMERVVKQDIGAMAVLVGKQVDLHIAKKITSQASSGDQICVVSNDNAPGQVVVSGHGEAIERVKALAGTRAIKTKKISNMPGHSHLMGNIVKDVRDALEELDIKNIHIPWVSNATAEVAHAPEIGDLLLHQLTAPVRWRESMLYLETQGVGTFIECGASSILTNMVDRIVPEASKISLNGRRAIDDFLDQMTPLPASERPSPRIPSIAVSSALRYD